jgi:hypothetical protein
VVAIVFALLVPSLLEKVLIPSCAITVEKGQGFAPHRAIVRGGRNRRLNEEVYHLTSAEAQECASRFGHSLMHRECFV